ncbi:MAG: transporter substrate-binding protein [Actinomycetia bacterium]|jgi:ABC-type nitrate/sulfonate/bicarbonate transport system substrate-binding protein|nr:transporter substrate-binding protein [Actinomycetes bacterium]
MASMMARRPPAGRRSHRKETLRSWTTYSAETARLLWFFQQIVEGASEQAGTRKGEAFVADEFDLRDLSLDRRSFLRRGAAGGIGVALLGTGGMSAILAACGSSSKPAATGSSTTVAGAKDLGELTFQLSWIKNVEFAGEYIADTNGYYKDGGFSKVTLLSGGPTVQQDSVVQGGKALVCISAPDITSAAINQGANLVTIGAQYQKNPFAVMSLATKPILTPDDMKGKKIGVQATNEAVWNAFLKANGINPSSITKVPVQFDPSPLVAGTVDGWFSFVTNEPNLLKTQGVETKTFLLADYKYPLVSETYVVKKDSLTSKRDAIKAMLVADIKGWQQNLKDPTIGAKLAANVYGKDQKLTVAEQTLESTSENLLIATPDTKTNGLFTITDALIDENISTLALANITITKDKLFDMSVLQEVYSEHPELKTFTTA